MRSSDNSPLIGSRRPIALTGVGVVLMAFMLGCDAVAVPGSDVPFELVGDTNIKPWSISGTRVFRTASEWEVFVEEMQISPVPSVDFTSHMVLGVFWGDAFYGGCHGHAKAIQSVHEFEDKLFVEVGPLPDLGLCRAIVFPRQFITVERVNLDVIFIGDVPGKKRTVVGAD